MRRGTIRRAVLMLAAGGLLFGFGTMAAPAAPSDDAASAQEAGDAGTPLALVRAKKPRSHKVSRAHKAKVAARAGKRSIFRAAKAAEPTQAPMPEAVANANAQMPAVDAKGAATATDITPPPLEAAAAEQLTELGKSLSATPSEPSMQIAQLAEDSPQPAPVAKTPEPARPMQQARASASTDAWAQSSLIGKIFIAFGGMLTLASAARMLVA